ncbi:unnamed protein product, partial [Rotaria sordida]
MPPPTSSEKISANLKMLSQCTSSEDVQEYLFI